MNIVTLNAIGEPTTTSLAIADGVGNQHKNVMELIRQNIGDFEEFGRVTFETRPFETNGGVQSKELAILNEPQATLLLTYMRNNEIVKRFKKQLVKAFYELKRGAAQTQPAGLAQSIEALGIAAKYLNLPQSGVLTMLQKGFEIEAPHLVAALPAYAVDAPPSEVAAGSSLPTASATQLLKERDADITVREFNAAAQEAGLLERRYRRRSNGDKKRFWIVTEEGLKYGKNITSPQSPRETQPHWYVRTFGKVLEEIRDIF